MKINILKQLTIVLSLLSNSLLAYYICPSGANVPSNSNCYGSSCDCAIGIQSVCLLDNVVVDETKYWTRGRNIAEICKSGEGEFYKNAAIATFFGPDNTYDNPDLNQHAAIFLSCSGSDGSINVNDQWIKKKKWTERTISYDDSSECNSDLDNSSYYYLIE